MDPVTNWYPFMLAASMSTVHEESLEVIYVLLKHFVASADLKAFASSSSSVQSPEEKPGQSPTKKRLFGSVE